MGTYSISLKVKVRLTCSAVRSKLFRSKHTHGPAQVRLNKQKSLCGCSLLVFADDQHLGSGIRDHPGEPQPAKWLCASAVTRPACRRCFQGHMLLGSLHVSKWSLSIKVFLEIWERGRWGGRWEDGLQAGAEGSRLWFRFVSEWVCYLPKEKQKPSMCPHFRDGQLKWA